MKYLKISFCFIIMVCIYTCDQWITYSSQNGNNVISIQVQLKDENPNNIEIKEGVSLYLEGTSYTTKTDSLGWATLTNLPDGIYNIIASYEDYISTKWLNCELKNDTFKTVFSMSKLPSFEVKAINVYPSVDSIYFEGYISNSNNYKRNVSIFFSMDSTVSINNSRFGLGGYVNPLDSSFHFSDHGVPIKLNGFPDSGMVVYCAAYGLGGGSFIFDTKDGNYSCDRMDYSPNVFKIKFIMP